MCAVEVSYHQNPIRIVSLPRAQILDLQRQIRVASFKLDKLDYHNRIAQLQRDEHRRLQTEINNTREKLKVLCKDSNNGGAMLTPPDSVARCTVSGGSVFDGDGGEREASEVNSDDGGIENNQDDIQMVSGTWSQQTAGRRRFTRVWAPPLSLRRGLLECPRAQAPTDRVED